MHIQVYMMYFILNDLLINLSPVTVDDHRGQDYDFAELSLLL
jgi:hypothetical protein